MPKMLSGITYIAALAVLVPAFVLCMQFAVQSNAAAVESAGVSVAMWLTVVTLLGGIAYVIALAVLAFSSQSDCHWCLYFLGGYALYVAGMIGYVSSGNFVHQLRTSGVVSALSNNALDVAYIVISLVLFVLIIAKSRLGQAAGA